MSNIYDLIINIKLDGDVSGNIKPYKYKLYTNKSATSNNFYIPKNITFTENNIKNLKKQLQIENDKKYTIIDIFQNKSILVNLIKDIEKEKNIISSEIKENEIKKNIEKNSKLLLKELFPKNSIVYLDNFNFSINSDYSVYKDISFNINNIFKKVYKNKTELKNEFINYYKNKYTNILIKNIEKVEKDYFGKTNEFKIKKIENENEALENNIRSNSDANGKLQKILIKKYEDNINEYTDLLNKYTNKKYNLNFVEYIKDYYETKIEKLEKYINLSKNFYNETLYKKFLKKYKKELEELNEESKNNKLIFKNELKELERDHSDLIFMLRNEKKLPELIIDKVNSNVNNILDNKKKYIEEFNLFIKYFLNKINKIQPNLQFKYDSEKDIIVIDDKSKNQYENIVIIDILMNLKETNKNKNSNFKSILSNIRFKKTCKARRQKIIDYYNKIKNSTKKVGRRVLFSKPKYKYLFINNTNRIIPVDKNNKSNRLTRLTR